MTANAFLGKAVGGFIGGNFVNYLAKDLKWQDGDIPLWLITLIKYFFGSSGE